MQPRCDQQLTSDQVFFPLCENSTHQQAFWTPGYQIYIYILHFRKMKSRTHGSHYLRNYFFHVFSSIPHTIIFSYFYCRYDLIFFSYRMCKITQLHLFSTFYLWFSFLCKLQKHPVRWAQQRFSFFISESRRINGNRPITMETGQNFKTPNTQADPQIWPNMALGLRTSRGYLCQNRPFFYVLVSPL